MTFFQPKTLLAMTATYFLGIAISHQPSAISHQPSASISITELIDNQNAAVVLSSSSLLKPVTLAISKIDTSLNRRDILKQLFAHVTSQETNDIKRVEAWVRYLQDRIAHPKHAPLHKNGQAIYDPLWIIKNRLGHCGQTNRVLVDGLAAVGIKARLVQLKAHVAAEAWLDGQWRFLDADWLNLGQFVRHKDGSIPSANEIHLNPSLLKGLRPGLEFRMYVVDVWNKQTEPYARMFSTQPFYYIKTATNKQEKNPYYGWNYYQTVHD